MAQATLAKVGNSTAVFIPSALRKKADVSAGDAYTADSPRKGVIVMRFNRPTAHSKLEALKRAQATLQAMAPSLPAWPQSATADDLIQAGKETHAHGILPA